MTTVGLVAGILTTGCWLPQMVKSWRSRSTNDFSWLYLIVLMVGVSLWALYGVLRSDVAVILANAVTVCFLLFLLVLKAVGGRTVSAPSPDRGPSFRAGPGSGR